VKTANRDQDQFPTVDVIICARNEARRIGDCLDSLLAQDYRGHVNIFVADNGSTDSTVEIVRKYPVTLINERERGSAAARNSALEKGSGKLVAFFDAHCIANSQWISAMARAVS
jgi:glycosyltransferase involved in cell wall biosynthesis